jgi:hypothetical protein
MASAKHKENIIKEREDRMRDILEAKRIREGKGSDRGEDESAEEFSTFRLSQEERGKAEVREN